MKNNENQFSRRSFLKSSAMLGLVGVTGTGVASGVGLTSCSDNSASKITPLKEPGTYYAPELPDKAPDGQELKCGVIGCGGRGSGAAENFLNAANGVTITALADVFPERVYGLRNRLKERFGIEIPDSNCFVGLDAYKQVIDSGVDMIIDACPPFFRAEHFRYAVEKGKHAFLEKPICVDPAGYRVLMAASKVADAKGLSVVTGTQRHHQRCYIEAYKKVMEGTIGEITGGTVYWNQSMLWYKNREKGWNDFEYMVKDWVNWKWLSGDHIVEQHVHNIDVFTWFTGLKPKSAVGFGSRQRRVTGDQYDNFSVDFEMENGIHMHSMCRQINGCKDNVSEFFQGTKGSLKISGFWAEMFDLDGNKIWSFDHEAEKATYQQVDPYTLEHVNWISCIRSKKPLNQTEATCISNMGGIMGREAAYTGQETTWETMTASALDYTPADLNIGKMDMSGFTVAVPGR